MHAQAALLLSLVLIGSSCGATRHATVVAPFADGTYEDFPAILMHPVGTLAAPSGRAVEVSTRGAITTVRFLPDGRITWRITWGEHGPETKETLVDGELFTSSRFGYDEAGHLLSKDVAGPGDARLHFDYVTDDDGHILSRTGALPSVAGTIREVLTIAWTRTGSTEVLRRDDVEVRRDERDPEGRLLRTMFTGPEGVVATLDYVRDGASLEVFRTLGASRSLARPDQPDPAVSSLSVAAILGAPIERHEALLFLGAPSRSTDEGHGASRTRSDDWSPEGCWLNQISLLHFDAAGSLVRGEATCICGFCVDARAFDAHDAPAHLLATDEHWWSGPWVVLDGVRVTPDHHVMTPEGSRAARTLEVGDPVLDASGRARPLRHVEHLGRTEPMLTRNLRTSEGTFAAGGLLFASEAPSVCP